MRTLTLSRHQRVTRSGDFARAYKQGNRARGSLLVVVAVENGLDQTRLGLSVGKSCWKSAVKRNRVKRLFREAFRLSYARLPQGVDLILIPGQKALEPALEPTTSELVHLAKKAYRRYSEKLVAQRTKEREAAQHAAPEAAPEEEP